MSVPTLVCFGEVLWDIFPDGKTAGGAPMNVAIHAQSLGLSARMVSRIGQDELGTHMLEAIASKGLDTQFIQQDPIYPTGVAYVSAKVGSETNYSFPAPAAWDFIETPSDTIENVRNADAFVFGSLACRADPTCKSLLSLLPLATIRIFDINLRAPYYHQAIIEQLLQEADIVKVSDEELHILLQWYEYKGSESDQMAFLRHRFDIELLILTKGGKGAACINSSGYFRHPGFEVAVKDTVGSGDAFLAGFIAQLLKCKDIPKCLEFACAIGAIVATQTGATPHIPTLSDPDFIDELMLNNYN